jgi:hypothetical protein
MIMHEQSFEQYLKHNNADDNKILIINLNNLIILIYVLVTNKVQMLM